MTGRYLIKVKTPSCHDITDGGVAETFTSSESCAGVNRDNRLLTANKSSSVSVYKSCECPVFAYSHRAHEGTLCGRLGLLSPDQRPSVTLCLTLTSLAYCCD